MAYNFDLKLLESYKASAYISVKCVEQRVYFSSMSVKQVREEAQRKRVTACDKRRKRIYQKSSRRIDQKTSGRIDYKTSRRTDQKTSGRIDQKTSGIIDQKRSVELARREVEACESGIVSNLEKDVHGTNVSCSLPGMGARSIPKIQETCNIRDMGGMYTN